MNTIKEHTEQPQNEWVSCEGYSAQEYPDFKKGWGIECFNGTKGTIEAYHNPYLYIEGQFDEIHKMNVKAYITFEQPQSVLNTIDVKQPFFKGKGEHSVNELEKMCQQYEDYVSYINSQPKAIYNDVWDEELINKFFYYLKYDKGVDTLEDSFMNDFKQHYSLIFKEDGCIPKSAKLIKNYL